MGQGPSWVVGALMAGKRGIREISPSVVIERGQLWTKNANPGKVVHKERTKRVSGVEWRHWDPRRSKLASGILRTKSDPSSLLPIPGSTILYLGAGHGSTISFLHDHLCGANNELGGRIIGVDIAPRCLRDLNRLAEARVGIVPVLGDARGGEDWGMFLPEGADWLFQDVAQPGQTEIVISAAKQFLKPKSFLLLSLKMASERWDETRSSNGLEKVVENLTAAGLSVEERIDLKGWEDEHFLFVAQTPGDW